MSTICTEDRARTAPHGGVGEPGSLAASDIYKEEQAAEIRLLLFGSGP